MKLERMLYILTYLTRHEKARAKDLAEKLEVSVRTIYRDIDAIAQAGIPVVGYQGAGGGIGIVEGYRLDRSLFTGGELQDIVTGLKGLNSISADGKLMRLIEKLSAYAGDAGLLPAGSEILIDLSPWNRYAGLGEKITCLKEAIRARRLVTFTYIGAGETTEREAEPCVVVFKDANWYLYAYCRLRSDFRLFKLKRMRNVKALDQEFAMREFTLESVRWDTDAAEASIQVTAAFDRRMEFIVLDIFGEEDISPMDDGRLRVTFRMPEGGGMYSFLMSFGTMVEVLEPEHLRRTMEGMARDVAALYAGNRPVT